LRLVVADTGPINYLILIGCVDLLPSLFETVLLPVAVAAELKAADAPTKVQVWIAKPPSWAEIRNDPPAFDPLLESLDAGEKAAIALARIGQADLLLMDERDGVKIARKQGLRVTGTLGVLDLAAERGLVDFAEAVQQLQRTTFHRPEALLQTLLRKHSGRGETTTS
jgi:predicted nucleic acid-binding protein